MPIGGGSASIRSFSTLPPVQKTLLDKAGTMIFDALDAPGNFTRSLLVGDLGNAAAQLGGFIPGVDSRRVPGSEVTGLDDDTSAGFWTNLAVEIFADPLLFVNQIGKLTKAGKALQDIQSVQRTLKAKKVVFARKGMNARRLKEIEELEGVLKTRVSTLRGLKPTKKSIRERSAVTLGVPFGKRLGIGEVSFGTLSTKPFLTPAKSIRHQRQIERKLTKVDKIDQRLTTEDIPKRLGTKLRQDRAVLQDSIERSQKFGDAFVTGHLGAKGTKALMESTFGDIGRGFRKRFKFESRDPQLEMLKDVWRTETARDIAEEGLVEGVARAANVETIAKLRGVSIEEESKRLVSLMENPNLPLSGMTKVPIPKGLHALKMKKLRSEFAKRFKALNKRGEKRSQTLKEFEKFMEDRDKLIGKFVDKQSQVKKLTDASGRDQRLFQEIVKGPLLSQELDFIRIHQDSFDKWIPLAKELGIDVDALSSSLGLTKFVPRLLSKEALALRHSKKLRKKYDIGVNQFNTYFSGSHRRELFPELSIDAVNELLRKDLGIDFDFFRTDIAQLITDRRVEMHKVLNKAAVIGAFTDTIGTTTRAQSGAKAIKAEDLFKRFKLNPEKAPNKWISREASDDLERIKTFFTNEMQQDSGFMKTIYGWLNASNSIFQASLTAAFPAFHHRNLINNIAMNMMAGVKGGTKYYDEMRKLQRLAAKGKLAGEDLETWLKLNQVGAVRAGQFEEYKRFIESSPEGIQGALRRVDEFFERPLTKVIGDPARKLLGKEKRVFRREEFNLFTGRAYGSFVEENARGAHYLAKRAEGLTEIEAMRSMNKWLFDYSKLTDFEKQRMRPLFLFYTWSRNNIPLMLKTVITNPRFGSLYTKLTGTGDEEVPQYLNRGFAFKAPPGIGKNEYFGSLGLGIEDLNILNVGSADPNITSQVKRLFDNLLTRVAPIPKEIAQAVTGREFFTGRDLVDIPISQRVMRSLPTSRVFGTGKRLLNEDTTIRTFLISEMTGIRTYTVDPKRLKKDIASRRALATGKFRRGSGIRLKRSEKDNPTSKMLDKELRRVFKENK